MATSEHDPPLAGIRVVDFSTLLPGPLATLILAEAGAEVIKVERPEGGDDMRHYPPALSDGMGAGFALLNRGKRSIALDLKDPGSRNALLPLIDDADILVEQFRPGVMDRLGFGYDTLSARNPKLVYCAITGWGQDGPLADVAGHDLNYVAEAGLLALGGDGNGAPTVPPGLIADIGGGALPAVSNIMMALFQAVRTGTGRYLDIAMTDNLFAWNWWAQAMTGATGAVPTPGGERLTGGSPRYRIYRTRDGRHIAVAPLEEKFWRNFCTAIELPEDLRDDSEAPDETATAIARILASRDASEWEAVFDGKDACCRIIRRLDEALDHPHFSSRGLFDAQVSAGERSLSALPVPLAPALRGPALRGPARHRPAPNLGEANDDYLA